MREVTDSNILAELNAKEVTDPILLQELESGPFPSLTAADPTTLWDQAKNIFRDPKQERAKAEESYLFSLQHADNGLTPGRAYELLPYLKKAEEADPRLFTHRQSVTEGVKQAYKMGITSNNMAMMSSQLLFGEDWENISDSVKEEEKNLPAYEDQYVPTNLFGEAITGTAQFLPSQIESIKQGGIGAIGGGALGSLGFFFGPEIGLPAMYKGMKIGGGTGAARASFMLEGGNIVKTLKDKGVADVYAREMGMYGGGLNALVEMGQAFTLFSSFGPGKVGSTAIKSAIGRAVTGYATFIATETAQEVTQEGVSLVAENMGYYLANEFQGLGLDYDTAETVAKRMLETARAAALSFVAMGIPGSVTTLISDNRRKAAQLKAGEAGTDVAEPGPQTAINVQEELAKLDGEKDIPEISLFGIETDAEGNPITHTLYDSVSQSTFDVPADADSQKIQAAAEEVRKETTIDETDIESIMSAKDEELDSVVAGVFGKYGETPSKIETFRQQVVEAIGDEEQADTTVALLEARAKSVGMTPDEYVGYHGLEVEKGGEIGAADLEQKAKTVTETPEFKKWFGDSKVVDEKGEPLVVYHGTNVDIKAFDPDFSAQGVFWFSDSVEDIKSGAAGALSSKNIIPVYLSSKNLAGWEEYDKYYLQQIKDMGFDGIKLDNNYIVFEPTQIKSISNKGTFDPSDPDIFKQGAKAAIDFTQDNKVIIKAFESADVSSMVHELGHLFRRELDTKEMEIAAKWAGQKDAMGKWSVDAEEKFARGFEKYLRDGKAPVAELKAVFEKFKQWLTEIYKTLVGSSIDVEITPEIRGVFDGLLTKQERDELYQKEEPVKTKIRKTTGQARGLEEKTVSERDALRASFKKAAQAARVAYKEGNKEGVEAQKAIMRDAVSKLKERQEVKIGKIKTSKEILDRRRETIRNLRDYLQLSDNDLKKITKKDIRLMSNLEFKKFKDDLKIKAVELADKLQAKNELMHTIFSKRLQLVDNYRRALELPTIQKMTTEQLREFDGLLQEYHEDDVFLTQRELERVDFTSLKGIHTWREAREKLAAKAGISIEELATSKITGFDSYKWDSSLVEKDPFFGILVKSMTEAMIGAEINSHAIENKIFKLAKAVNESQSRSIAERAIPQEKLIFEYLEADIELKEEIAGKMNKAQLDLAHFIQEYFGQALEYLIESKSLERGMQNYITHMRRSFFEQTKEHGLKTAVKTAFKNNEEDAMVFNILDEDTGKILPLAKFFQFSMQRTGQLDPSYNVVKVVTTYAKMFEKKKAFDAIIPELYIYAQALTPRTYTERGLLMDDSLMKFVKKWVNNKKGRRISFDGALKQGGKLDVGVSAIRTFVTLKDLGFNIPVGVASIVGEQGMNFVNMGTKNYTKGTARLATKRGKEIVKKYEAFVGRSFWEDFNAPGKEFTGRLMDGLFGMFHVSTVLSNKQFLLGSLTKQEWASGELSKSRLADMRLEMGRWRAIPGTSSLVGSTSAGKAGTQYKTWAVPAMRTSLKNLKEFAVSMGKGDIKRALTEREARELYRTVALTSAAVIVGGMAIDADDDSLLGKMKAKAFREATSIMQSVNPKLWLTSPRILSWLYQLADAIETLVKLEEYKTRRGLKGVEKMKKTVLPYPVRELLKEDKRR